MNIQFHFFVAYLSYSKKFYEFLACFNFVTLRNVDEDTYEPHPQTLGLEIIYPDITYPDSD